MDIEYKKQIILEKLFSLHRFGIKPGLERTLSLLESCENPHNSIKTIHIAGTNGKGSVAAILASILTEAGYTTGLYTSPHIKDFNERIRINGHMIEDNEIVRLAENLLPNAEESGATFFEITTVMAFKYFADRNVDIAIIETGMGGRFDSTNVINPLLSIITNISMEHKEYLGDTLEKIAFEKAGIIKKDVPVILGNIKSEIEHVFESKSDKIEYAKNVVDIENIQYLKDLKYMLDLKLDGIKYEFLKLNIAGFAQIENLSIAFASLKHLFKYFIISNKNIYNGIRNVKSNTGLSSRIELINPTLPVIFDVAHNPDAILNLVNTIDKSEYKGLKWNIVLALMKDKDVKTVLNYLKPIINELVITKPTTERANDTKSIKHIASELNIKSLIIENPNDAYKFILSENKPSLIVGSFYLIGDIVPD